MADDRPRIRFRAAVELAKERAAGQVHNMELDEFFSEETLAEYDDMSDAVFARAKAHVATLITGLIRKH
jgi:hypothetical protein